MTKKKAAKKVATTTAAAGADERRGSTVAEGRTPVIGSSTAAEARLKARLSGTTQTVGRQGVDLRRMRERHGEMVTVPRLDRTIIYHGQKYYPSEEPVEIPFGAAFTHGLLGELDEVNPPGAMIPTETVTDVKDVTRGKTEEVDNGAGGSTPAGNAIPVSDLGSQAPSLQEINAAAEAAGRSNEQVLAARQAEIDAKREARTETGR